MARKYHIWLATKMFRLYRTSELASFLDNRNFCIVPPIRGKVVNAVGTALGDLVGPARTTLVVIEHSAVSGWDSYLASPRF